MTDFTYGDFFGRDACAARGYERRQRMRRVDLVAKEKYASSLGKKNLRDGMLVSTAASARGKHVSPEPLVADHVQDSCDVFAGRVA